MKRIKAMTVQYADGSEETFNGDGTLSLTKTATKQDEGSPVPLQFISLSMDITNE